MATTYNTDDDAREQEVVTTQTDEAKATTNDDAGCNEEAIGHSKDEEKTFEAIRKFTDEDEGDLSIKSILGGDILMSKWMVKQVVFVIFVVALCITYTANRYSSQQESILIDSLRTQLQDVKYNVLTQSSELMNLTRQSRIEEVMSHTADSVLHNSLTPPFLIRANEDYPVAKKRMPREVLVSEHEDSTAKDTLATDSARATKPAAETLTEKKDTTNNQQI